jgi:hypothetical protein
MNDAGRPAAARAGRPGRPMTAVAPAVVLGFVLVLALAARLFAWPHQSIVTVDGTSYIRLARDLLGGPDYATVQPPGYPVMMMPLLVAAGATGAPAGATAPPPTPADPDGVDPARGTALLAALGATFLLVHIARRHLATGAVVAFGLALALTPILVRSSVITMSEMPYLLGASAALLAATRGRWWLAGALGGLAFHVRPEGMFLVGGLALAAGRRPAAWLGLLGGLVLAGFLPALAFNHARSGTWSLTLKDTNLIADTPVRNESIRSRDAEPAPDAPLADRLARFGGESLRVWPGRFRAEMTNLAHAIGWPWLLAGLAGLVRVLGGGAGRRDGARADGGAGDAVRMAPAREPPPHVARRLLAAPLLQLLVVPFFGGVAPVPRLIVPVLPFVLLLGLISIQALLAAAPRRRAIGLAAAAIVAAGWLVAAIPEARALKLQEDGYYPELVRAGRELRGVIPPDALVLDRKPYTAFYAGARFEQVPFGSYHATMDAIQAMKGDYLVVDEAVAEVFRPDLMPLAKDSFTMLNEARLDPIWFDPSLVRRHTAVYRIVRPGGPASPIDEERRAAVRALIARAPHQEKLHVLHAEILWLAGRRAEALGEYEAARAAGTFRAVDEERERRLRSEIAAADSLPTAGR